MFDIWHSGSITNKHYYRLVGLARQKVTAVLLCVLSKLTILKVYLKPAIPSAKKHELTQLGVQTWQPDIAQMYPFEVNIESTLVII